MLTWQFADLASPIGWHWSFPTGGISKFPLAEQFPWCITDVASMDQDFFFLLALRKTLALPTAFLCPGKDHDIGPQSQGCGLIYSILPSFLGLFLNINCVGTGAGAVCAPEAAKPNGSSQVKNKKVGFKSLSERAAGFPMALTSQRVWWMFPLFVLWPRKSPIEIRANPMISSPWLIRSERSWDYLSWFIIPWATSKARPSLWRCFETWDARNSSATFFHHPCNILWEK